MIVYISIGNSDDKLTQREWSDFQAQVQIVLVRLAIKIHGSWVSDPRDEWQNACWCLEPWAHLIEETRESLIRLADKFGQDSIAWAEVKETEFLSPSNDRR